MQMKPVVNISHVLIIHLNGAEGRQLIREAAQVFKSIDRAIKQLRFYIAYHYYARRTFRENKLA